MNISCYPNTNWDLFYNRLWAPVPAIKNHRRDHWQLNYFRYARPIVLNTAPMSSMRLPIPLLMNGNNALTMQLRGGCSIIVAKLHHVRPDRILYKMTRLWSAEFPFCCVEWLVTASWMCTTKVQCNNGCNKGNFICWSNPLTDVDKCILSHAKVS